MKDGSLSGPKVTRGGARDNLCTVRGASTSSDVCLRVCTRTDELKRAKQKCPLSIAVLWLMELVYILM